jgi:hypothetical protein
LIGLAVLLTLAVSAAEESRTALAVPVILASAALGYLLMLFAIRARAFRGAPRTRGSTALLAGAGAVLALSISAGLRAFAGESAATLGFAALCAFAAGALSSLLTSPYSDRQLGED